MYLLEIICLIHCQLKRIEIYQNQENHYQNQKSCNPVLADLKELQQLVLKHNNQFLHFHRVRGLVRLYCDCVLCYHFGNVHLPCKLAPDDDDDAVQQHEPIIQYWQVV